MLSHEASIIATKETAEMKMIEFFIPRKLSLTALGIQSRSAAHCKACRMRRERAHIGLSGNASTRYRQPQKRAGPKAQFVQQSCNGNRYTREGISPLKAGARVRLPYALATLFVYQNSMSHLGANSNVGKNLSIRPIFFTEIATRNSVTTCLREKHLALVKFSARMPRG